MPAAPFATRAPSRMLLVCTQRIGDVILSTPLARSLKRAWPDTPLDVLVLEGTEGALEGNPDVAQVLAFPQRTDWRGKWAQLRSLWRHYDLAVTPMPTDRSRLYGRVAAPFCVGFVTVEERGKGWMLSRSLPFDNLSTHTVAMGESLCALLGIQPTYEVVPPRLKAEYLPSLREFLTPLGGAPYAVLHPFPKYAYKMWRSEAWVAFSQWLESQGLATVITGGRDREEQAYCSGIARQCGALDLSGQLTLAETAEIVDRARLYVGTDTAVTHIAAATGTPTVALFGPSNPVKWGPWPVGWRHAVSPWPRVGSGREGNVWLIQGEGDCVPCLLEGCDRRLDSTSRCLLEISEARVIAAAQAMLALNG